MRKAGLPKRSKMQVKRTEKMTDFKHPGNM